MTNTNIGGKTLITELGMEQDAQHQEQQIQLRPTSEEEKRPSSDESERGILDNQIFHVLEAVPPQDYDAPYSKLPSNVVLTRVKVTISSKTVFIQKNVSQ